MSNSIHGTQVRISSIESDLRALAAHAADVGDWPVVRAASLAAENLGVVSAAENEIPEDGQESAKTKAKVVAVARRRSGPKRKSASTGYPRFEIERGDLVKIGWSKREKSEYRHRAPKEAVGQVTRAISTLLSASDSFSTDNLFPIVDPRDGTAVPTHQGYIILRWLRELGLVTANGRSEYNVENPSGLEMIAQKSWDRLNAKEKD